VEHWEGKTVEGIEERGGRMDAREEEEEEEVEEVETEVK